MNKYLFLDIDGVLNHEKFYQNRFNLLKQHKEIPSYPLCEFDPFCVEQVNRILYETNANLVISSSWRFDKDLKNILMIYYLVMNIKIKQLLMNECIQKK